MSSLPVLPAASVPLPGSTAASESRATVEAQREVLRLFDARASALRRHMRTVGLPPDAAEDVLQETFLALFRHLVAGGATDNLEGWLFRVAQRQALKARERASRRRVLEVALDTPTDEPHDPARSAEATLAGHQTQQRIRAVINALPERDRQCIRLRSEGIPYRAIAAALGISLGGVAKALARAASRLERALKE